MNSVNGTWQCHSCQVLRHEKNHPSGTWGSGRWAQSPARRVPAPKTNDLLVPFKTLVLKTNHGGVQPSLRVSTCQNIRNITPKKKTCTSRGYNLLEDEGVQLPKISVWGLSPYMLTPSLRRQLHWTFASVKWQLDAIEWIYMIYYMASPIMTLSENGARPEYIQYMAIWMGKYRESCWIIGCRGSTFQTNPYGFVWN